jgi:hypothetical protein
VDCTQTAQLALDGSVVVDTTSAVVLDLLPNDVRQVSLGAFRRTLAADGSLRDAKVAQVTLAGRSSDTLTWDEQAQSVRLVESSSQWADRLADDADRLASTIAQLRRLPSADETLDERFSGATFGPCAATLALAAAENLPLWADDAALRTLARSFGLRVISTPALLDTLAQRQMITSSQHQDALMHLVQARVGDAPLSNRQLLDVAERENWQVGAAAVALGRPADWTNLGAGLERTLLVLKTVQAHNPSALSGWAYHCVRGSTFANVEAPQAASEVAGIVLTIALYVSSSQGELTKRLVAAARHGLSDASFDPDSAIDPLAGCIQRFYAALTQVLPPAMAAQYVLAATSDLDENDRQTVLRVLLR